MSSPSWTANPVPLDAVIITDELSRRPPEPPDDRAVNRALVALAREMADSPTSVLQKLVESALHLTRAHSSGISLLETEQGRQIFRWHGVAGEYAPHLWGTTPREFSPCGTVLDTNRVQLMSYLDRHFEYFADVKPRIVEALLVPFHVAGTAVGTVWVISHNEDRKFDARDVDVLNSLREFAGAAYQVLSSVKALKEARGRLEQTNRDLVRSNEELKSQIVERKVAELAVRSAYADLEQFAFVASHDLQEPLRTVAIFTELLEQRTQGILDGETQELVQTILGGALRMKSLVEALLKYSRLGDKGAAPAHVSLKEVLATVLANLEASIVEHGAVITHGELPTVYADQAQLEQLLQNLIANAIKYRRPEQAPEIHLSSERGNGEWILSVRDNGQGFSPEYAEQIFRIFSRLHGSDIPGTGIGLAVCRKIVERNGGRIWAISKPGEGSTFFFTVPIRQSE